MRKNNLIKIIIASALLSVFSFICFVNFSDTQAEAATYKVKVGSKSVFVRTAHGSAYAKAKAQKAFSGGRLMSGCRNVSYNCHWCGSGGGSGGVTPPPPVDVCPNLPGNQGNVPDDYKKVDGNCLPDMCLNITGFQQTIPDGFQDVGGKICQVGNSFFLSCHAQDSIVKPNEEAAFVATPVNHKGLVTFQWFLDSNNSGSPLSTQRSEDKVFFKKSFSDEGNKRLTVVATDEDGNKKQKYCGVMVTNKNEDELEDEIDLNDDGILDLVANGGLLDKDAAVQLNIDRTLTNTTCKLTWDSTNTLECLLTNTEGLNEKVALDGSRDVSPGIYTLRCFTPSLRIIESEVRTCRMNPDVREI